MISALSLPLLLLLSQSPQRVGTHGMVLFGGGGGPTYASHIPMFHPPHDLQLVLEVALRHPAWAKGKVPSFSETGHTLVPERLDLTALAEGKLTSFRAAVFRGNFEAGGQELWKDVQVEVRRVVLSRALDAKSAAGPLTYYWLKPGFLVHAITAAPGFDQVLRVRPAGRVAAADGAALSLGQRPNDGERRPAASETLELTAAGGETVRAVVERELSFLVGPEFVVPQPNPKSAH